MTETPERSPGAESDRSEELTPEKATEIGLLVNTGDKFFEHFQSLLSLPEGTIRDIARRVNTEKGFDRSDETGLAIVREIAADAKTFQQALAVAYNLHTESIGEKVSTDEVLTELSEYCERRGLEGFEEKRDAIGSLIEVKEADRVARRRKRHEQAVFDTLSRIGAVQDLRAVFKDDEVVELVPMTMIELVLSNPRDEDKHVSFQIKRKDLEDLRSFIDDYLDELKKVEVFVEGSHHD